MLYPDFKDLIAIKDRRSKVSHLPARSVKAARQGNHNSPFRGQGLEFDAVRAYVPGDDIRNIDWKVTARSGSPHLKLFKEERERNITICVDMNESMRFGTRRTFKSIQAAHIAALLGWQSLSQHDSVSGCLFGDVQSGIQYFPPKRTRQSFCAMLGILCRPPVQRHQIPIHHPLKQLSRSVTPGSIVYIISDFIDLNFHLQEESGLCLLRKSSDVVFIAVNDIADKTIPPIGSILFSSNTGDKIAINTQNDSGRSAYANFWKREREQLHEITNKFKIPLIELGTESEIHKELFLGLKGIAKKRMR